MLGLPRPTPLNSTHKLKYLSKVNECPLSVENKIIVFFCSEGLYRFKYTFTCSCSTPLDLQVLREPLKFTTGELISKFSY